MIEFQFRIPRTIQRTNQTKGSNVRLLQKGVLAKIEHFKCIFKQGYSLGISCILYLHICISRMVSSVDHLIQTADLVTKFVALNAVHVAFTDSLHQILTIFCLISTYLISQLH